MKGDLVFYLTVLPMHLESNYHCLQSQFVIDYLHLDFKKNKTVNNDVNMIFCGIKTVLEKRVSLTNRLAYVIGNKLALLAKSAW